MKYCLIVFALCLAGCSATRLDIRPLSPYQDKKVGYDSSVKNDSVLFKFYVVDGFDANDSTKISDVEKFAFAHLDNGYEKYRQYELFFYRKTPTLNDTYKDGESDPLANHDNDLVLHFIWINGKYSRYLLMNNGDCLNCDGELK